MKTKYLLLSILFLIIGMIFSDAFILDDETVRKEINEIIDDDNVLNCTFVCNLIDERANEVGIKGTDLGVGMERNDEIWLLFGDVVGTTIFKGGASAVAILPKQRDFDFTKMEWKLDENGNYYQPLHSRRVYGDASTVPAGGVEIDGRAYIFAMRVIWWNHGPAQTHAYGVLFRENENGEFEEIFNWSTDEIHVNTAPVFVADQQKVYMICTATYRNSPVYLSFVEPQNIEEKDSYYYFSGRNENGMPKWTNNIEEAQPLEGMENVKAGEISFVYNPVLQKYFIMFDSFSIINNGVWLYYSDEPYGPYSRVKVGVLKNASWMQENWSGCYGGYIIPYMFGEDGKDIYFTISVWKPYITVVLKTRFDIDVVNKAPNKPSRPQGPSSGKAGHTYSYSSSTTDANLDRLYYLFDWGDGSTSDWLGPYFSGQIVNASHTWDSRGKYSIRVKAKDIYGKESEWSDPLVVSMPKSMPKSYDKFLWIEKINKLLMKLFGREIISFIQSFF